MAGVFGIPASVVRLDVESRILLHLFGLALFIVGAAYPENGGKTPAP